MAGGSEIKEETTNHIVKNENNVQEKSSIKTSASALPHILVEMPALSPTMVRNIGC